MPKIIKKKKQRKPKIDASEFQNIMGTVTERLTGRARTVAIAGGGVLVVSLLIVAIFFYVGFQRRGAERLFYEGYTIYHGMYAASALVPAQRSTQAIEKFRKSYDKKKSPMPLLYIANSHELAGRNKEALEVLDELLSTFPSNDLFVPLAMYKRATLQLGLGQMEDALKTLEALYRLPTPAYADLALVEMARLLADMDRIEESRDAYETIKSKYPDSSFFEEAMLNTEFGGAAEEVVSPEKLLEDATSTPFSPAGKQ